MCKQEWVKPLKHSTTQVKVSELTSEKDSEVCEKVKRRGFICVPMGVSR